MRANSRIAVAYDCLFPFTTGGGERWYRALAESLHARGREVDYLTSVQWDDPPDETAFAVLPMSGRLRLYDSGGVRRSAAALAFAWGLFRALRRRRRTYGTVIVSGLPVLNVFAARAALIGSGTTLVVDYLEVWGRRQWVEYAGRLTGTVAWLLQRLAVAITPIATCHSRLTERQLRREGMRGRVLVSPGLIDSAPTHAYRATPGSPPYVLYAGRHIPDKRVEALPAAVRTARERIPGLRLIVLGTGPSSDTVDDAIAAADGHDWCERPGFVSEERLAELMGGAACLVNPSRREGYGLVVVEAAAHGTPTVLVHDEGNASTELITPGVNGFVATGIDPESLGEAIVRAAEGGTSLRSSTRAWYEQALRTRTVDETVGAILTSIDGPQRTAHRQDTSQKGPS